MEHLSHGQVMILRQQMYDTQLQNGTFTPFVYPWDTFPLLYLFIAFCINPYLSRASAKIYNVATFSLIAGHCVYIIANRRCLTLASGYVIGLSLTWGTLASAILLLFHDPRQDFARLEWRPIQNTQHGDKVRNLSHKPAGHESGFRQRTKQGALSDANNLPSDDVPESDYQLVWQLVPSSLGHRIDWAIDLLMTFRGPNWNFRIPTLSKISAPAAPTKSIRLSSSLEPTQSIVREIPYDSPASSAFRRRAVRTTIILYLLIDVVKVIMMSDGYFLGVADIDAPSRWRIVGVIHVFSGISLPVLTRTCRLLVSLWGILNELCMVFSLSSTLVYSTLPLIVNPRKFTYSPLMDTRFFPTLLGDPVQVLSNMGLAGFWGNFWHQMFRHGISEPSRPLIRYLNLSSRSGLGRAIQLLVAFSLTGALHMIASVTCFSIVPSKPLLPMLFFLSQAVGIVLQTAVSDLMFKTLKISIPASIRKTTNVLFVVVWLYFTAPWLCDDFARCGIWLFEPIPISFIRGWRGEGWWHWGGIKIEPWTGLDSRSTSILEKGIGFF